jgi:hypothetical protein
LPIIWRKLKFLNYCFWKNSRVSKKEIYIKVYLINMSNFRITADQRGCGAERKL